MPHNSKKAAEAFECLTLKDRAVDLMKSRGEKPAFALCCDLVSPSFATGEESGKKAGSARESVVCFCEGAAFRVYESESDEALGYTVEEMKISALHDVKLSVYVGYLAIECKRGGDGEDVELCRSTYREKLRLSEAVKWLKLYFAHEIAFSDIKFKVKYSCCPKCGRPFRGSSQFCNSCADKKATFRQLYTVVKPQLLMIILSMVLFLVTTGLSVITPNIQRILVDDYIKSETPQNIVFTALLSVVLTLVALSLASTVVSIVRNNLLAQISTKTTVTLRSLLYEKIQMMSIAGVSRLSAGELISRVTNDTDVIGHFISWNLPNIVEQVLTLLIVGSAMVIYNWKLALLILLPIPFVLVMFRSLWRYTHRLYHRQWIADANASTVLHDIFQGVRVVKVFGTEAREIEKYNSAIREVALISVRNETLWCLTMPVANFLLGAGSFIVLFYVGSRVISGAMTLGEMTMFSTYVSMLYGPLRWAANLPRMIQRALTSVSKVFEIVNEDVDVSDAVEPKSLDIRGEIEFKNVYFGYNDVEDVLKDISFSLHPGEMLGIVGKSGVGKSTLINLVMRMYDVRSGVIKIDGVDVRDIAQESLRSQIGVVLQETFLFTGSIYDNIAYAKPSATREEVIAAAKLANAHTFIMKLPDSYNTRVGEKGYTLSGGERQRIAIARAVLHNPKILILDEATSALDTETEKLIQDSLAKLTKNRTTLAIAHRLSTLRNASRLLVLDEGHLAETGTHEELMRKNGIYASLVMAQRQMSKLSK